MLRLDISLGSKVTWWNE